MKGVFPGSFDPPTRGHLDLIRRAASIMDHVTICVMVNISKAGTIPPEERVRMLEKACLDIPNVSVDRWDGLLADYMRGQDPGTVVIRGVRSTAEFEQERTAASVNRALYPGLETILLFAGDGMDSVSSSAVREIAAFGGDYRFLIPEQIAKDIDRQLKKE